MINRFVSEYNNFLEGTFVRDLATECQGGARINYIFHKIFKNIINVIDPFEYLSEQDIQTAIKNA
jgi:dynamin 1-like protein